MRDPALLSVSPLGFPWEADDPFLFCAYHLDHYPRGAANLGPAASLAGRDIGMDFQGKDGWRMYHGDVVPGFPSHPHRGFETVTLARRGFVDHSDSLGATARFGAGDAQWLTAGKGIVHAEMFPLLNQDAANPADLFQIWLNLPAASKMVEPHFAMFWSEEVPVHEVRDDAGRRTVVTVVAGALGSARPPAPPPASWAARASSEVAIWTLRLDPGARFTLPAASAGLSRSLYVFRGAAGTGVGGQLLSGNSRVRLRSDAPMPIVAGPDEVEILLLQGRPIGEPVAQHGPFVMNSPEEIRQAFTDYQRTRFGGWPWREPGPTHPREAGRFARYPDGTVRRPGQA